MRGDGAAFAVMPNQGSKAAATGTTPLQAAKPDGRPVMSDARVPAGQIKGAALWSAFVRPVCDDKIPAQFSCWGVAGYRR